MLGRTLSDDSLNRGVEPEPRRPFSRIGVSDTNCPIDIRQHLSSIPTGDEYGRPDRRWATAERYRRSASEEDCWPRK